MADAINFPGTVEWSGENPGISLKERRTGRSSRSRASSASCCRRTGAAMRWC